MTTDTQRDVLPTPLRLRLTSGPRRDVGTRLGLIAPLRRILGALGAVVGVVVLVAWWQGFDHRLDFIEGAPPMVANTALMALGLGSAVALLPAAATGRRLVVAISRVLAALTALMAAVTLAEYVLDVSWSAFDLWLVDDQSHPSLVQYPGRPSPHTAAAFLCLSLGVLAIDRRPVCVGKLCATPTELTVIVGLPLPLTAMLGYVFDLGALYGVPGQLGYTGMALDTSAVLVMVALAIALARPDEGMMGVITSAELGGSAARWMLAALGTCSFFTVLASVLVSVGLVSAAIATASVVLIGLSISSAYVAYTGSELNQASSRLEGEAARARLAALVDSSSDGIHAMTPDGIVVHWNPACEPIYGRSAEEMVGRPLADILPPDRRDEHQSHLAAVKRGERVVNYETVRLRSNGTEIPVSLTVSPIVASSGELVGISTIVRDIRARKAVEAALSRAHTREQQLRSELERVLDASSTISTAVTDLPRSGLEVLLTVVAEQARVLSGAEYAAVGIDETPDTPYDRWACSGLDEQGAARLGRALSGTRELWHTATRGKVVRVADASDVLLPGDAPVDTHHGVGLINVLATQIWFEDRPVGNLLLANKHDESGFTDADERLVVMLGQRVGAALEMARLYETLALERNRLQAIFDHMPEGVVILDESGAVVQRSPSALRLAPSIGHDTEHVGVGPVFHAPDGSELEPDQQPGPRALRGQGVRSEELAMLDWRRHLVPVLVSATPIRTPRGKAGAVVTFQNISALKELERLREEWASVIAHDLRQPVNAIDLAAQVLLHTHDDCLDDQGRSLLGRIRRAASRLNRLVGDLLDASRIEAEHLSLEPCPVDLRSIVEECVEELRDRLHDHPVALEGPSTLPLQADADRLHQIVVNLLSNAAKYADDHGPIRLALSVDPDDAAHLQVANRGPGIAAHELPGLFERFQRTRSATLTGQKGVGLGLYITRGLVEAHGGRIWAESTPGEWTTFHVVLPRCEVQPTAPAQPGLPNPGRSEPRDN